MTSFFRNFKMFGSLKRRLFPEVEKLLLLNNDLQAANEQLRVRNRELTQSAGELGNFLTSAGLPVLIVGRDLRIRTLTSSVERLMNVQPTDLGRPIADLHPIVAFPDLTGIINNVIADHSPQEHEVQCLDGRWYLLRVHPYCTTDGGIDGAIVLFFDIDQHKRAQEALQEREAHLRMALDGGRMGMWVWDPVTNRSIWNAREYELLGLPMGNGEVDANIFFERVHPDDQAMLQDILTKAIEQQRDLQFEFRVIYPDGEIRWLAGVGSLYPGQMASWPTRVIGVNYDITERVRTQEALKEADRRKDEFLAVLSHELRNPLAALSNVVQSMRLRNGAMTYDTRVQTLLEGAVRQLVRLVDDLLDVSRITQGKIELRKEHTTLAQIVDMAVASSRVLIDENGHQLTLSLPSDDVLLDVDPIRLGQALTNLLMNAAKFMEAGGKLWLIAEVAQGAPGRAGDIVFRVRDTGIGISATMLPRIFDMFTQGNQHVSNRVRNGLGVGLALAKRLVELHGGAIDVSSDGPDAGSEFTVRLPGVVLPGHPDAEALQLQTAPSEDTPCRILLVDDDWLVAFSFEVILKNLGHEVHLAHDGPNAIETLKTFHPDVVLIDISMPGMDGYEVARRIRAQPEFDGIVLIAQTGYGSEADARRAQEAGFDYHLIKPVELPTLQKALVNVPRKV